MARTKKRLAKEWFPGDKRGEKPEDITNYKSKDLSYFKPEDLRKILTEQEISFSEERLESVTERIELETEFYFSRKILFDGPKLDEVRVALEELLNKARAMEKCLNELDYRTKYDHLLRDFNGDKVEFYDNLKLDCGRLSFLSESAIKNLPAGSAGKRR